MRRTQALTHVCRCHAVQEAGESWDQDEFAKHDKKKPASVMVEYPAGSNVWYNGVPQKWSAKEALFRIGGGDSKFESLLLHHHLFACICRSVTICV